MTNREINHRVNSIKKALIAIGFVPEVHNTHSFFRHFDIGFRNRAGYDVYVTYNLTVWVIKVVDLENKNDGRNVINGTLSFDNERDNKEFFDCLFGQILFKLYVKGRSDATKDILTEFDKVTKELR